MPFQVFFQKLLKYFNEPIILTHPVKGRRHDVVATSFYPFQQHCWYVLNETPNGVLVVRFKDVTKESRDNVSRVHNNNIPSARLLNVSD